MKPRARQMQDAFSLGLELQICRWHGFFLTELMECPRCWPSFRWEAGEVQCPTCGKWVTLWDETGEWKETGDFDEEGAPIREPVSEVGFVPTGYHHGLILIVQPDGRAEAYRLPRKKTKPRQAEPQVQIPHLEEFIKP